MENHFIVMGCSCTAVVGWTKYFKDVLKLRLTDLSEGSSSNMSQNIKLKNLLLSNDMIDNLDQVVLLWQITGISRNGFVIEQSASSEKYRNRYSFAGHEDYSDFFDYDLKFTKKKVSGLLSHNPFFHDDKFKIRSADADFEQYIADIVILSKLVKHSIVWYGWKNIDKDENVEKIYEFLAQFQNITLIPRENSFIDWCRQQGLSFLHDNQHPTAESSIEWGKNILLPKIKQIG